MYIYIHIWVPYNDLTVIVVSRQPSQNDDCHTFESIHMGMDHPGILKFDNYLPCNLGRLGMQHLLSTPATSCDTPYVRCPSRQRMQRGQQGIHLLVDR